MLSLDLSSTRIEERPLVHSLHVYLSLLFFRLIGYIPQCAALVPQFALRASKFPLGVIILGRLFLENELLLDLLVDASSSVFMHQSHVFIQVEPAVGFLYFQGVLQVLSRLGAR